MQFDSKEMFGVWVHRLGGERSVVGGHDGDLLAGCKLLFEAPLWESWFLFFLCFKGRGHMCHWLNLESNTGPALGRCAMFISVYFFYLQCTSFFPLHNGTK